MSGIPFDTIVSWLTEDRHLVDRVTVLGAPLGRMVSGACVDSRLVRPGDLFVALPGERTDGHEYVDHAVQAGASCALVCADRLASVRPRVFGSVRLLPVDDTLAALQSVARRWRIRFPDLVRVGVTGSNGKTSTKEMIASVLHLVSPTVASRGNYNSDIGLPVEVLRIRDEHRYGVFELGMNRPGEISLLSGLVEPDLAIITNIGLAHVGMVGSQENIAREKRAIFSQFSGNQVAVIPAADRYADFLAFGVNGTVVRYDMKSAGVRGVEPKGIEGSRLVCDGGTIDLHVPGAHMVTNAFAAITALRQLGISFAFIREGLEQMRPVFGRSEVVRGSITVIRDCYNANPDSTRPALELLSESPTSGRRVAIIGAMKELGDESERAHHDVYAHATRLPIDVVWFYGDEFVAPVEGGESLHARVFRYDEWDRLVRAASKLRAGDLVLLKGSRSVALERLTPVIVPAEVEL